LTGLTDLQELLTQMSPELGDGEYVFASFPGAVYGDLRALRPLASIQEEEGLSLVIPREVAENAQIPCEIILRKISLRVHSSLEAVGLTAAISQKLTSANISANVIAGHFHDHIFVPAENADEALRVLKLLS
jgi:hypothetical protein